MLLLGGEEATGLLGVEYVKRTFVFEFDLDLAVDILGGEGLINSTFLVTGAGFIIGACLMTSLVVAI